MTSTLEGTQSTRSCIKHCFRRKLCLTQALKDVKLCSRLLPSRPNGSSSAKQSRRINQLSRSLWLPRAPTRASSHPGSQIASSQPRGSASKLVSLSWSLIFNWTIMLNRKLHRGRTLQHCCKQRPVCKRSNSNLTRRKSWLRATISSSSTLSESLILWMRWRTTSCLSSPTKWSISLWRIPSGTCLTRPRTLSLQIRRRRCSFVFRTVWGRWQTATGAWSNTPTKKTKSYRGSNKTTQLLSKVKRR